MSVNSIGNSAATASTLAAAQTQQARKPVNGERNETTVQQKQEPPKAQASNGKLGSHINTFA